MQNRFRTKTIRISDTIGARISSTYYDNVFLAMGFTNPIKEGLLENLNVELEERGNVKTDDFETSVAKVFCAGDMRRGQSLVVWAIAEGRDCARRVDAFLKERK